jgi:hypothetical protein
LQRLKRRGKCPEIRNFHVGGLSFIRIASRSQ